MPPFLYRPLWGNPLQLIDWSELGFLRLPTRPTAPCRLLCFLLRCCLLFICATTACTRKGPFGGIEDTKIPVLMYHQIVTVDDTGSETVISRRRFREQMQYLADHQYTTLTVEEFFAILRGERRAPPKPVLLTFDDGWANVLDAVPTLQRLHLKASFWVFPGTGIDRPYLTWDEITALSNLPGFEIQAHSLTHPWDPQNNLVTWTRNDPPSRSYSDATREIAESKRILEEHLGKPVRYFAWPCGWYTSELVQYATSVGYEGLMTAASGTNRVGDDPRFIKRIMIDGSCPFSEFVRTLEDHQYHPCATTTRTTGSPEP